MHDFLFISILPPLILLSLFHPWSGLLVFGWIVILKPESLLFSLAAEMSLSLIIATTTAVSWAFSKERKSFDVDLTTILFIALASAAALSTATSLTPDASEKELLNILRNIVFLLLLRVMLTSRLRLDSYIWLLAFAMIVFGLRLITSFIAAIGEIDVSGPFLVEIIDRHHLAFAMLIALPLLNYLWLQSRHRWTQICLLAATVVVVTAIVTTGSLAAVLGLLVTATYILWNSKRSLLSLFALLLLAIGLHSMMPAAWKERLDLVQATDNPAVVGPLPTWQTYLTAALDRPLTGVGLDALEQAPIFIRYAPALDQIEIESTTRLGAQSTFFQVLGDLGFFGLAIYVALLVTGFCNARWISQRGRSRSDFKWMGDLGRMVQVCIVTFCILGAVHPMAFYETFLSLLIVVSAVRCMAKETSGEQHSRPIRCHQSGVPVDMSAIAAIWQKAADSKVSDLHRRHSGRRLSSDSASAK
ncbi:MAG: putative O-glycosylation ligase, exosortase A system-associated [Pseudomonadota bacterium]